MEIILLPDPTVLLVNIVLYHILGSENLNLVVSTSQQSKKRKRQQHAATKLDLTYYKSLCSLQLTFRPCLFPLS